MPAWYLEDVTLKALDNPDSFFIPSLSERTGSRITGLVRLHFVLRDPGPHDPRAERMWVEITARSEGGASVRYEGQLTNQPTRIPDLNLGDRIEFGPENIAQVILPMSHPDALDIGEKIALVSARVLEAGARARWAYREKPDRENDSGWRLFTGEESQDYVDNAANIRACNVYWLVDRDPTLRQLSRAGIGEAFERRADSDDWVRVEGWTTADE